METLDRKLLRDVGQSWHMLLAVSAIIAVGIGCFVGMLSAAGILNMPEAAITRPAGWLISGLI